MSTDYVTPADHRSLPVRAVLFEPYGTLIDIETDERDWHVYLYLSRYLEYRGVSLTADELRWLWFEKMAQQVTSGAEAYPEVDARAAWSALLEANVDRCRYPLDLAGSTFVPDLVVLHRSLTRRSLRLMEGARALVERLSARVRLGAITDSQPDYIRAELAITGLAPHFSGMTVSGEHGFCKPDRRLFERALADLRVSPAEAVFVGVDTGKDIAGARAAGLRTVLVLTPYGSKDIALGEPDLIADSTADVAEVIAPLLGV